MAKGAEAFRSIGEVAELIGVAPHVLRYWETQFSQLRPMKRPDGRRYYRPEDVHLAAGLCEVLREDGLTIRGAKKLIARDRGMAVRARGVARLKGEVQAASLPESKAAVAFAVDISAPAAVAKPLRKQVAKAQTLPLFPELDEHRPDVSLLQRLISLTARLQDTKALPAPARRQAVLLQKTIAKLGS